jgi:hypothetical protein
MAGPSSLRLRAEVPSIPFALVVVACSFGWPKLFVPELAEEKSKRLHLGLAIQYGEAVAAVDAAQGTGRSEREVLRAEVDHLDIPKAEELGDKRVLAIARPVVAAALPREAAAGEDPKRLLGRERRPVRDLLSGRKVCGAHAGSLGTARCRNK